MIRILVVEDSPTVREFLVHLLDEDPEIQVVGQASTGSQAVDMSTRLLPDLITMDVVMPDMDGLEATRRIMARHPTPILIVTAHTDSPEMNIIFEAMKAGALDVMPKFEGLGKKGQYDWGRDLVDKIKILASLHPRLLE